MNIYQKFNKYVLLFILFSVFSLGATAQKKVALLIGNSTYLPSADNASLKYSPLPLCANDVDTIGNILESLDFHTIVLKDGNKDEMRQSLAKFEKILKGADVAVFYYSGHANYVDGQYYLIPAKTDFEPFALSDQFLRADIVKDLMTDTDNSKLSLLFFDACRNVVQDKGNKGGETITPNFDFNNLPRDPNFNFQMFFPTEYGRKTIATHETDQLSPFSYAVSKHLKDGGDFSSKVWHAICYEFFKLTGEKADCQGSYQGSFCFNTKGEKAPEPNAAKRQTEKQNKKYVRFVCDAPNAVISFGNKKFQAGDLMEFEIGKSYTYSVSAKGYEYYADRLTVSSTTPSKLQVTLRKAGQADLIVSCNTSASVYIDNQYVGRVSKNVPQKFISTSGQHTIRLSANGYYEHSSTSTFKKGSNYADITLERNYGDFWEWDDYNGSNSISYHFSPKYQIALSYMYRPEYSRFSYGVILGVSPGWFKGGRFSMISSESYSYTSGSTQVVITDENGKTINCLQSTTSNGDIPKRYSEELDPQNEAKKYNANALVLANVGYSICNGLLVEAGIGAGFHQDVYELPFKSYISQTITTNMETGDIVDRSYGYIRNAGSQIIKDPAVWSPALRLGGKALIPLDDWDKWFISVGGGYTWMITNHKYSSWDANIGIVWTF